jgi:hypothetical protein
MTIVLLLLLLLLLRLLPASPTQTMRWWHE